MVKYIKTTFQNIEIGKKFKYSIYNIFIGEKYEFEKLTDFSARRVDTGTIFEFLPYDQILIENNQE